MADSVQQVLNVEPLSPRTLNPAVPIDLETVCLKCLEKEPAKRYATAQLFAEELGRFLNCQPVLARPVGRLAKTWRWCRRNPRLATAMSAALLSLLLGLGGVAWQWRRTEAERALAKAEELLARQNAYAAEMNLAQQALAENNLGRARELLDHYWPQAPSKAPTPKSSSKPNLQLPKANIRVSSPAAELSTLNPQPSTDLRGWEWRYLWQQCQGQEQFTLLGHSNRVHAVAFSPDGCWLASAAADDTVRLWDLSTGHQVAMARSPSQTYNAVLFSPDAQRLLTTAAHESVVHIWQVPSLEPAGDLKLDGEGAGLALSPDGQALAAVGAGGVKLWSMSDWHELVVIPAAVDLSAGRIAFSADGRWLAANTMDGRILVWDRGTKTLIATLTGHTCPYPMGYFIRALGFVGNTLVSAGSDSTVRVWDVAAARQSRVLQAHRSMVTALAFSPGGKIMATASADQTVKLWDVATWRVAAALRGHLNEVWAVAFSPDGATLATGAKDDTVKLWSTWPRPAPSASRPLPSGLRSFHLLADGRSILLVKANGALIWFGMTSGRETKLPLLPPPVPEIADLAVAPGGRLLAVAAPKGPVRTWTLPEGRLSAEFIDSAAAAGPLAFSADGKPLAAAGTDGSGRVWDVASRRPIAQVRLAPGLVTDLLLSPDARYLAIGYNKGMVDVWEVVTRRKLTRWAAHKEGVSDMAFFLHPFQLITASGDGTVKIWDLPTQRLVTTFRGSLLGMNSLAVSPDERRLAAGTSEGVVKLWDLASLQEVATFRADHSGVQVAFSPDGNDLIAVSQGQVSVWHAPSFQQIEAAEAAKPAPHLATR